MKLCKNMAAVATATAGLSALTAVVMLSLTGCLRDNTEICPVPDGSAKGKAIVFGASVGTRALPGHPIENGANNIPAGTSFGVYAFHLPEGETDAVPFADLQNACVTRRNDNTFSYAPVALWPTNMADQLNFIAYYPWVNGTMEPEFPLLPSIDDEYPEAVGILYFAASNPKEQVDLMYAVSGRTTGHETVALNFRHALTRVRFDAKAEGWSPEVTPKIKQIRLMYPVSNGTLALMPGSGNNPFWIFDEDIYTADISLNLTNGLSDTGLTGDLESIMAEDGDLLMIPQEVAGLNLWVWGEVNGRNVGPFHYPLDGTVDWAMNEIVTYEITLKPTAIEVSTTVDEWDNADQTIIVDGQYKLEMSVPKAVFDIDGGTIDVDIETDYNRTDRGFGAGVFIELPDGFPTDWLTVTTGSGTALSTEDGLLTRTVKITATAMEEDDDTVERNASLTVRAGNMNYKFKISQGEENYQFNVSPTSRLISFWSNHSGAMLHNTFGVDSDKEWSIGSVNYPAGESDWGLTAHKTSDGKGFYVQCDRNATGAERSATVSLDVELSSGRKRVDVMITQDKCECGLGGVTQPLEFNGRQVQTHMIGGDARGYGVKYLKEMWGEDISAWTEEMKGLGFYITMLITSGDYYACWMLENADYGTPSATQYNDTHYAGPYYTRTAAPQACPPGWRLPNMKDIFTIFQLAAALEKDDPESKLVMQAFHQPGDQLTGGYSPSTSSGWTGWDKDSYFMSSWDGMVKREQILEAAAQYPDMVPANTDLSSVTGTYYYSDDIQATYVNVWKKVTAENVTTYEVSIGASKYADIMTPVRCVKDKNYLYE